MPWSRACLNLLVRFAKVRGTRSQWVGQARSTRTARATRGHDPPTERGALLPVATFQPSVIRSGQQLTDVQHAEQRQDGHARRIARRTARRSSIPACIPCILWRIADHPGGLSVALLTRALGSTTTAGSTRITT